jgi:hypothetical protein
MISGRPPERRTENPNLDWIGGLTDPRDLCVDYLADVSFTEPGRPEQAHTQSLPQSDPLGEQAHRNQGDVPAVDGYFLAMAKRVWRVNWIGFLGFIGFVGFLGFFYDAPQAFVYFAYFEYFYYFTTEITAEERRRIRTAGTAAYLMAFLTNMTFIVLSYIRGSVDYETGFYLAYIMGSVTFPVTTFLMETPHKIRRIRDRRRERLSAAGQ